jgi:uncharacterized protein (TIGR00369 family)
VALPTPDFPDFNPETMESLGRYASEAGGGLPTFLGITTTDVSAGRLACELAVRDDLLNPFGSLHGGVISALTDHVLGAVLYTVIPRGSWAATTEFKLNLLAPIRSGTVRAESQIIAMTKRTAVVRIEITNDGRGAGVAQGTVLVMAPKEPIAQDA